MTETSSTQVQDGSGSRRAPAEPAGADAADAPAPPQEASDHQDPGRSPIEAMRRFTRRLFGRDAPTDEDPNIYPLF